jgi:hypothetical protein
MVYKRKSWQEKFESINQFEVKLTDKKFADIPEGAKMLIATPKIIEDYIFQIPEGTETDLKTLRKDLALQYGAEYTCPVTTGIFLRIVSEKAFESYQNGKELNKIAPFWRTIKPKDKILTKLSFGSNFVFDMKAKEVSG